MYDDCVRQVGRRMIGDLGKSPNLPCCVVCLHGVQFIAFHKYIVPAMYHTACLGCPKSKQTPTDSRGLPI